MARIRSVHPGQSSDEDFVAMSMPARVFCLLLRCHADDQGIFEWKPKSLKMKIFPADNIDVEPILAELVENRQVKMFESDGRSYGAIRNFRKYQRPKKPSNSYPLPDALRTYVGLTPSGSPPVGNQDDTEEEIPPQREEGGGRRKEEGEKENAVLLARAPEPPVAEQQPETSDLEKREVRLICEAFNAELETAFAERAPQFPHASNSVAAQRMVTAGATADFCRPIFAATLAKMAFGGKQPPKSLSYFTDAIADALAQSKRPMPKGTPNGRPERRSFDPEQQRQSDRAAIAGALLGGVDSGLVAGIREGAFSDGAGEGDSGFAAGDRLGAETLSASEYRVLRGADGPADHVCEDVQSAEAGPGEGDRAVCGNAEGPPGRSAGEGDLGDDQDTHGLVPAAASGGCEGQGGGSVPNPQEAPSQAGNGASGVGKITDRQLVDEIPSHLKRTRAA